MKLTNLFHKMETECSLFELVTDNNIPIWDILRYRIYINYYYQEKDRKNIFIPPKRTLNDFLCLSINFFRFIYTIIFSKTDFIFLSYSRNINNKNEYYDRSIMDFIKHLKKRYIILEAILFKKTAYKYIYNFNFVLRRFFKTRSIPIEIFNKIEKSLNKYFNIAKITHAELNQTYSEFLSDYYYYKLIFKILKPKKNFISSGNPKASILAAKFYGIETYLLQHAGIEFDEIDYSYPSNISFNSQIIFADFVLTYGDYWCKNLNVPTKKIIPIGNNYLSVIPRVKTDNSILVISTKVHGNELSKLTLELAKLMRNQKFVFKLHPNEYNNANYYSNIFKNTPNVSVFTTEVDTSILVAKSKLVILIVSAVIYEALNQNKIVMVYKKINYERQLIFSDNANVIFFDAPREVKKALTLKPEVQKNLYYKKFDSKIISLIFKQKNN